MKKLIFIILSVWFISSFAFAQRQTFIAASKNNYDAIMIDWVRTGNSALGSWTRIGVNVDNKFTRTRLSISANFSKNAVSIVLNFGIINGETRGKNLILSLENSNGELEDEVFSISSISTFNKLIQKYQVAANTQAKNGNLFDRYTKLEEKVESNFKNALGNYEDLLSISNNKESFNIIIPKSDYDEIPVFYKEIMPRHKRIMETLLEFEDYKSESKEFQCGHRDYLETNNEELKTIILFFSSYKDHIPLAKDYISKKFNNIYEYFRIAINLEKSLEDSIKVSKFNSFNPKYSLKFLNQRLETVKNNQKSITSNFLILVEANKQGNINLINRYFKDYNIFMQNLTCS